MGLTLAFGLIIAVPTVIIAGPVFGTIVSPWFAPMAEPRLADWRRRRLRHRRTRPGVRRRTVLTMMLPVALMLVRAAGELLLPVGSRTRAALDVAGAPIVAMLAGVVVAMFTLGCEQA